MKKTAIVTDSNSGITQSQAREMGIHVLPMPFYIDGKLYFEDISLTQEEFYEALAKDAEIATSQPSPGDVTELWNRILKDYDEIVHIPMSSGLSGSCETAMILAADFDGRVQVVNNQRISVTQKRSVADALRLAAAGAEGAEIKRRLEDEKFRSSIYITVETLKYLKKGGRVTAAGAALGTILNIKPVLQIQGGKLDAYEKVRGMKAARDVMIRAVKSDVDGRFADAYRAGKMRFDVAYSGVDRTAAEEFAQTVAAEFGAANMAIDPLSLSVSCHIGSGALALACAEEMTV